jgi:cytochrome c biogenesis protein CcmG/thiol:disulfide interchange protein DsbE
MRKLILSLFIVCLFVSLGFAGAPVRGDDAPGFSLSSINGDKVSLADFKGKVVLVGMFHICAPCRNQALEFNKVRKQLQDKNLVILGINTSGDSKKAVEDYLGQFPEPVNFPYLLDPGQSVNKKYIQRDMPTVLIIDKKGILLSRTPSVGAGQLVPFLKKLL